MTTTTATAPQAQATADQLAQEIASIQADIDSLSDHKAELLGILSTLHDLGQVDSKVQTNDGWTLQWSAGRAAYDYPPDIAELEAQLQAAKEAAVASKRAQPKPLKPFWTVRKPRPAKNLEAAA